MKTKPNVLTVVLIAVCLLLILCVGALSALTVKNMNELKSAVVTVDEKAAELNNKAAALNGKTSELSDRTEAIGGKTEALIERIEELARNDEDETKENDVKIADIYVIRDTTAISDAYKTGDRSALDDRQKETLKMASDIIDKIIEPGMTPYEKEEAVYIFLTTKLKADEGSLTVIPNSGEDADNPYGVLKYHQAVCVGYATTFRMFMHMLDIECMVVHNTGCTHSWDLIKLDGEWYQTDCYFDSGDTPSYRHFNLTDEVLSLDHDWDKSFFPRAQGLKFNYAVKNAGEVEDIMSIPAYVKEKIDGGETCFSLRVAGGITREEEPVASYLSEQLSNAVNSIGNGCFQYYWMLDDNGEFVLCMFYREYNYDPGYELPDEVVEEIYDVLTELFGSDWIYYY
ncbi:MAG: hypothetical protein J5854_03805 [Clostridia bacterium]|nr:hypothetical protein [Clostridia bacterium]